MASSGGEQGYWPGFVDALSNMVMTLIIIIVLLNVALVFFFFKATKSATRSVQAAVESAQKSSAEEIDSLLLENQRLMDELKKAHEFNGGPSASNKEDALDRASIAASKPLTQNGLATRKPKDQTSLGNMGETPHDNSSEFTEMPSGIEGDANAQTSQQNLKGIVADQELSNAINKKDVENTNVIKNNLASASGNLFIISYEDANIEFSADTLKALNKDLGGLISKDKNIKVDITVEILGSSQYSFMRRVAYYRASSIRNYILSKGVDTKRIVTRLIDANEATQYPRALIQINH